MENQDNHGDRMDVFTVTERNGRSWWTRVGSAFVNKDASITLFLEALPVNGKLQVRAAERERDEVPRARDRR